jgi:hypothetical protein
VYDIAPSRTTSVSSHGCVSLHLAGLQRQMDETAVGGARRNGDLHLERPVEDVLGGGNRRVPIDPLDLVETDGVRSGTRHAVGR